MGVLKIVKKKNSGGAGVPHPQRGTQTTLKEVWEQYRKGQRNKRLWHGLTAISLILSAAFLVYPKLSSFKNPEKRKHNILFEVKAIDSEGHPVAGARVNYFDKVLGVTDSYGEWRRFLRFRKGQTVTLNLKKRSRDHELLASKNLVVPIENNDAESLKVKATVKLNSQKIRNRIIPEGGKKILTNTVEKEQVKTVRQTQEVSIENLEENDPYYSVWFSVFDFGHDREGKTQILKKNLLPALKRTSAQKGLELRKNSPWQVGVGHIAYKSSPSFPGVIRVIARRVGSEKKIDFLKNYTGSSQITAEKILQTLKLHTPKPYSLIKNGSKWFVQDLKTPIWKIDSNVALTGFSGFPIRILSKVPAKKSLYLIDTMGKEACVNNKSHCMAHKAHLPLNPPSAAWTRFQIKVYGVQRNRALIYVGGLKASYVGSDRWSFWAKPGHHTYFSVIKEGVIVYRRLLPAVDHLSLPVISIPSSPIVHK
ncbi:MAG: hypothetical protein AB8G05_03475 [Oligoflexales bacterium]